MIRFYWLSMVLMWWPVIGVAASAPADCRRAELAVQVLGSGGPIADDDRAGSAHLLWSRGEALLLIDAGGGSFVRFGEAGAGLENLRLIAITHLHTDHVADLPALLKGAYFSNRSEPLKLSGPSGRGRFPALGAFVERMFDPRGGAFAYLGGLMDGSEGMFALQVEEVDAGRDQPVTVLEDERLRVRAVGVDHGPVPALGYRVDIEGAGLAFSGDQTTARPGFARLARGAQWLFMAHAIAPHAAAAARNLHATPAQIGRLAADTGVTQLVLTHWMQRSLKTRDESETEIRTRYNGSLQFADDLDCYVVL